MAASSPDAGVSDAVAHFDAVAATWDANPTRRALTAAVAAAICRTVPMRLDMAVLDYGCGTAALSLLLAPAVGRVVAADASSGMVAEAARKAAAGQIPNVHPVCLDLTRDGLPTERFDVIVSILALHHVADVPRLLAAWAALLRPGGWLAVADLCTEDGTFHGDMAVPHRGFDPAALAAALSRHGLGDPAWTTVHTVAKNAREYPVFLLVTRRLPGSAKAPGKP